MCSGWNEKCQWGEPEQVQSIDASEQRPRQEQPPYANGRNECPGYATATPHRRNRKRPSHRKKCDESETNPASNLHSRFLPQGHLTGHSTRQIQLRVPSSELLQAIETFNGLRLLDHTLPNSRCNAVTYRQSFHSDEDTGRAIINFALLL